MKRMKRCILFLFLFMMFIPFVTVHADPTCSEIRDKVDEFNRIEEEIETLGCDKSQDVATTTKCNKLSVRKNILLTDLFEIYEMDIDCDKSIIKPIIENNSGKCSNELSSQVNSIASLMLKNFYVIGTILFIIFGSIDFFKNVIASDAKDMPKNRKNFLKRSIALVLLYFLPLLINLIFSFLPNHYRLGTNKYVCNAKTYHTYSKSEVVSGYYSKDLITVGKTGKGKAIAGAAKANLEYAKSHGFTYSSDYSHSSATAFSEKNTVKKVCCASLIGASIYKAGVYNEQEADAIYSESAGTVAENLAKKGWIVIYNEKDLQPGDILVWRCVNAGYCRSTTIDGKTNPIGHVDIYGGNGIKYSAGGNASIQAVESKFRTNIYNSDGTVNKTFYCGLRYPGKKWGNLWLRIKKEY